MKSIPVVVLVLLLAGCSSGTKDDAPIPPQPVPSAADTGPVTRSGTVGQPFEVPGWRITVVSVGCGSPASMLGAQDDGTHGAGVCVAAISYTNTGSAAAGFDQGPDFAAFDGNGSRYEGTRWLKGPVNPGVTDTNELVFDTAAGQKVIAVLIGDVRVRVLT